MDLDPIKLLLGEVSKRLERASMIGIYLRVLLLKPHIIKFFLQKRGLRTKDRPFHN